MTDDTDPQEASAPPKVIDLDGLFTLRLQRDRAYRAEFGKLTTNIEVQHRWKLQPSEGELVMGLLSIARKVSEKLTTPDIPSPQVVFFGGSNILQIHQAAMEAKTCANLHRFFIMQLAAAIGTELETLVGEPNSQKEKEKAKANILKKFSHALDAITSKSQRTSHKSATTVEVVTDAGDARTVLLPWLVLEIARELAEQKRALPTKGEIQLLIGERFPQLRGLGKTKWRNTWKQCGLSTLAQGTPWEFEGRKRELKSRTKKR